MPTWYELSDEIGPGVDIDAEEAAKGIAQASGTSWAVASRDDRDRFIELACAAIEAVGGERV